MMIFLLAFLAAGPHEARAAAAHWNRGQRLYEAGRYTQALEEFKAGYESDPLPAFLINIGQTYRKMGERKKALTAYQQYLDVQPVDDPLRKQIESILRKLQAEERAERPEPPETAPERPVEAAVPAPAPAPTPKKTPAPTKPPIDLRPRAVGPEPAQAALVSPAPPAGHDDEVGWYGHWWVWALVGAAVVGGISVASTAGGGSAGAPTGSLGTIDGRR